MFSKGIRKHVLRVFIEFYSVTNSTGATQRFSTNHKTSSEQENRSLSIPDQSQTRDLRRKVFSINEKATKYLLKGAAKNVGWPRLSSLHCSSNLLAFYHECRFLIGYTTHYLIVIPQCTLVKVTATSLRFPSVCEEDLLVGKVLND